MVVLRLNIVKGEREMDKLKALYLLCVTEGRMEGTEIVVNITRKEACDKLGWKQPTLQYVCKQGVKLGLPAIKFKPGRRGRQAQDVSVIVNEIKQALGL